MSTVSAIIPSYGMDSPPNSFWIPVRIAVRCAYWFKGRRRLLPATCRVNL